MTHKLLGLGLRYPHLRQVLTDMPKVDWLEVHSENYYSIGGIDFDYLKEIREYYPISLHSIGMSLGSATGLEDAHIEMVRGLINEIDPFMISEHLSWSAIDDKFIPDLLPTPFTKESLDIFTQNVSYVQDKLKRSILLENPSTYFEYTHSVYSEAEFLNKLVEKTGAQILLDVNNVYVSAKNHGWSPTEYIDAINHQHVKEIHLAGHSIKKIDETSSLYIDSHDNVVDDEVWKLYEYALNAIGPVHSLLEWDADIPSLNELVTEASKIQFYLDKITRKEYA